MTGEDRQLQRGMLAAAGAWLARSLIFTALFMLGRSELVQAQISSSENSVSGEGEGMYLEDDIGAVCDPCCDDPDPWVCMP
ncbi:MAG: hypothetical protein CME16_01615 [Gemmatimonadetes bacterium]|nr:hypothetical protein [Gemmatimonadota bacterium]